MSEYSVPAQFIDLSSQQSRIRSDLDKAISKVLDHGQYIMGPEVLEFEDELRKFTNSRNVISCANGTDAITICLMAWDVGPGDAVFVPSFTYIATAETPAQLGATPFFVDVDKNSFNMDSESLKIAINDAKNLGLRPSVAIPVDLFGQPSDIEKIKEICDLEDVKVLVDAAQSFGATYKGKKVGVFGHATTTSFFPAKPLGCYGDGGAIFTNNEEFVPILKSIRVHGGGQDKYDNIRTGLNGRLDTIQAAILLEKLKIFENEFYLRNKVADYYINNISKRFKSPFVPKNYQSSWAQFTLLADNEEIRNMTINFLKERNIPSMIYYRIPLHLQKVYSNLNYHEGDFPISEDVAKRVFSIPMHPYLTNNQQDLVLEALEQFKY